MTTVTFPNGNDYTFPDDFFGTQGYEYVTNFPLLVQDIVSLQAEIVADSAVLQKSAALAQTATAVVAAAENRVRFLYARTRAAADEAQAAVGGVKISVNDTTAAPLNGKLVAGFGVTLTENNDGGNETLTASTNRKQIAMMAQSFG